MANNALPCASDCGKAKSRASTGTSTVPPPTPSNPDTRPLKPPKSIKGKRAAEFPACRMDLATGMRCRALAMIIKLTSRSQQPKPLFNVFGLTLLVRLAPKRALKMAVAAMAPAARKDARPSWI